MAIGFLLIAGCSSDSTDGSAANNSHTLNVIPYTVNYQELGMRAVTEGYSAYAPSHEVSIGLFILPEENGPTAKTIRYSNGTWHSQALVKDENDYRIFGFMPMKDAISPSITPNVNNGTSYTLTFSGIDVVSADDICFITGVKDGRDTDPGDLTQGKFYYRGNSDNNFICLLMDHLYASVRFSFSIGTEFSKLRSIKLRKLELKTELASKVNVVVTLKPNDTGADPVSSVAYNGKQTGESSAIFFESATGEELSSDAIKSYLCCFAPDITGISRGLSLVSTYDVYDRKGNKIRENCTATNLLPDLEATRGQRVTITLTVDPTFLYQLSDADLDNLFTIE